MVTRPEPKLPVTAVQTFELSAPPGTHWRPATCAEVECDGYLNGWKTYIDENTELGKKQAEYIRKLCGRDFTEVYIGDGMTSFVFTSGQQCFGASEHRVQYKPALYVVRDGDWRGNPTGKTVTHTRPEHWVEHFAEHQQTLADAQQKG